MRLQISSVAEFFDSMPAFLPPTLAVAGCVIAAFVLAALLSALFRRVARRWSLAGDVSARSVQPLRAVLVLIAGWVAVRLWLGQETWSDGVEHALTVALIVAVAWLVATVALVVEDAIAAWYSMDLADNRHARRVRTQVQVIRRVTTAVVVVIAASVILLTFPGMRAFGASMLASAGLISIIAGLAVQSALANVFAGVQIAFTDAIRVDDVVIVEGEWGKIEEITMTYVVVHIWDSRRLILPSTYFTTTPFQNWTRRNADLLGTVELDVDWTVPMDEMRAEMQRLLDASDLWDERVSVLQTTEVREGFVQVRALASAADAPTLWDLRCYLREGLVAWLATRPRYAGIPRTRQHPIGPRPPENWTILPAEDAAPVEPAQGPQDVPSPPAVAPTPSETEQPAEPEPGEQPPAEPESGEQPPAEPELAAEPKVLRRSVRAGAPKQRESVGRSEARLFTGSIDAIERSKLFAGPDRSVLEEREEVATRSTRLAPAAKRPSKD